MHRPVPPPRLPASSLNAPLLSARVLPERPKVHSQPFVAEPLPARVRTAARGWTLFAWPWGAPSPPASLDSEAQSDPETPKPPKGDKKDRPDFTMTVMYSRLGLMVAFAAFWVLLGLTLGRVPMDTGGISILTMGGWVSAEVAAHFEAVCFEPPTPIACGWGGGTGTCVGAGNASRCVCEPGWTHDSTLMMVENCAMPMFVPPLMTALTAWLFLMDAAAFSNKLQKLQKDKKSMPRIRYINLATLFAAFLAFLFLWFVQLFPERVVPWHIVSAIMFILTYMGATRSAYEYTQFFLGNRKNLLMFDGNFVFWSTAGWWLALLLGLSAIATVIPAYIVPEMPPLVGAELSAILMGYLVFFTTIAYGRVYTELRKVTAASATATSANPEELLFSYVRKGVLAIMPPRVLQVHGLFAAGLVVSLALRLPLTWLLCHVCVILLVASKRAFIPSRSYPGESSSDGATGTMRATSPPPSPGPRLTSQAKQIVDAPTPSPPMRRPMSSVVEVPVEPAPDVQELEAAAAEAEATARAAVEAAALAAKEAAAARAETAAPAEAAPATPLPNAATEPPNVVLDEPPLVAPAAEVLAAPVVTAAASIGAVAATALGIEDDSSDEGGDAPVQEAQGGAPDVEIMNPESRAPGSGTSAGSTPSLGPMVFIPETGQGSFRGAFENPNYQQRRGSAETKRPVSWRAPSVPPAVAGEAEARPRSLPRESVTAVQRAGVVTGTLREQRFGQSTRSTGSGESGMQEVPIEEEEESEEEEMSLAVREWLLS